VVRAGQVVETLAWAALFVYEKGMIVNNKSIRKPIGRPPKPGGPDLVVPVRLSRHIIDQVEDIAARMEVSRSEVIREMITQAVAGRMIARTKRKKL
jgi:hypothetical protein